MTEVDERDVPAPGPFDALRGQADPSLPRDRDAILDEMRGPGFAPELDRPKERDSI